MKITTRDRKNLNVELIIRGLDGNGRFETCGEALRAMGDALAAGSENTLHLGLVTGEQAPRRDDETFMKRYTVEAGDDEIENSLLVASFYYHADSDRFEVVAYLS